MSDISSVTTSDGVTYTIKDSTARSRKVLLVNVTGSGDNYSMDSTYSAIMNAINSGTALPVIVYNDRYYYLTRVVSDVPYFVNSLIIAAATYRYFTVSTSGVVTLYESSGSPSSSFNVTLSPSSWSQSGSYTITNSAITADNTVAITYPPSMSDANYDMLRNADIRVTSQSAGYITLQALGTIPTSSLIVTIVVWG